MPATPPKLIVILGAEALKALLNLQKLTDSHGIFLDCELSGCKALATYHPSKVLAEPHPCHTLKTDFLRVRAFIYPTLKESTLPKIKRESIDRPDRFCRWMETFLQIAASDIETIDLSIDTEIVSMSLTTEIEGQRWDLNLSEVPDSRPLLHLAVFRADLRLSIATLKFLTPDDRALRPLS
jgi:hypothetical protein